jgi:SAM-dependent MidA family methyltransferase
VTAPELSPLFGACLAEQCRVALEWLGAGSVFEFGAGSGRLAASVLAALGATGTLPERYWILELNPALQALQHATLAEMVPEFLPRVCWCRAPPTVPLSGVVLANEVIDALPVVLFEASAGHILERGIGLDPAHRLRFAARPATPGLRAAVMERQPAGDLHWPDPYCSEINLRIVPWITHVATLLRRGVVVLADYGYPRHEYYHPDRANGTLQCFYRHRVHDDPLWFPGVQDLTAAVDFTTLAEAAEAVGLDVAGFAEQAAYLLATGITDRLSARIENVPGAGYRAAQAVKALLLPDAMGARTKFLTLTRDYVGPVVGYAIRNDRHRL